MVNKREMDFDIGIGEIFHSLLMEVNTSMPAEIISFDPTTETAEVQPVLKRLYEYNDEAIQLPVLKDIKVLFPGSGNFWLTYPLEPGDYVLLIVCQRSLDIWLESGGIVDPDATRKFNLNDSIAIAGLNPKPTVLNPPIETDGISLRTRDNSIFTKIKADQIHFKNGDDCNLTVDADSIKGIVGSVNPGNIEIVDEKVTLEVTPAKVEIEAAGTTITGNLTVNGNISATGNIDAVNLTASSAVEGATVAALTVDLGTHVHSGVTAGTASSGPPVP